MSVKDCYGGEANRQLRGWKEIATALGKDESTVKRWAATRGLPVHRAPGTRRASVYAWTHQITDWLTNQSQTLTVDISHAIESSPDLIPASTDRRRFSSTALLAALIVFIAAAGAYGLLQSTSPAAHPKFQSSDVVQNVFNEGIYLYRKRNPESLRRAAENFERAIDIDPGFAPARAALAVTYDLMVEYGSLQPSDGYMAAEKEAQAALSLDSESADALAVLGDVMFFQDKRYEQALAYFERSIRAEPENALSHQWYAAALQSVGRYQEALKEITEAQRLDPDARSILVSKAMVLIALGDVAAGETILQRLLVHEPGYRSPYRFLAFAALERGDDVAYLAALRERFRLTNDVAGMQIVEAGATGHNHGGHAAMSEAMARQARLSVTAEPYFLAHVLALAGDFNAAASCLAAIKTRHAFYYVFDPAFKAARQNPSFQDRIRAVGLPIAP